MKIYQVSKVQTEFGIQTRDVLALFYKKEHALYYLKRCKSILEKLEYHKEDMIEKGFGWSNYSVFRLVDEMNTWFEIHDFEVR